MEAPIGSQINAPVDYRAHLAPRYESWCKSHSNVGKVSGSHLKSIARGLRSLVPGKKSENVNTHFISSIPNDVVTHFFSLLSDASALRTLRGLSKKWKHFVDTKTNYWKLVDKERIAHEFPDVLKVNVFGGVQYIQAIKIINPKYLAYADLKSRITWITPEMFEGEAMIRGIAPNGCNFISILVQTRTKRQSVLTLHETSPAFLSLRKTDSFIWIADSAGRNYLGRQTKEEGPLSRLQTNDDDKICTLGNQEVLEWSDDELKRAKALINGEVVTNTILVADSPCQLNFQVVPPRTAS